MRNALLIIKALQKELNNKLKELDVMSYDKVKENVELPFIKIGDVSFETDKNKSLERLIVNQELQVWSDYLGKKETLEILHKVLNKIYDLEGLDFTVDTETKNIFDVAINNGGVVEVQEFYRGYLTIQFKID